MTTGFPRLLLRWLQHFGSIEEAPWLVSGVGTPLYP